MSDSSYIYGQLPSALLPAQVGAAQCSPLVPGAVALEECAEGSLAGITMLVPPGSIERRYAMAQALRALQVGAPFTFLGLRDKGGARIGKELKQFGCEVQDAPKQHYRICTGTRPALLTIDKAIAEGAPRFEESLGLWTQPGVFSWDRIDIGSALLAAHLPALQGRGADLGCGIGFLSQAVLASRQVTHLTMVDIDRRAVAQARRNVDTKRTSIIWNDATNHPLTNLDFVVMNPPFHDGGMEDRALGQAFIRRAAASLRKGGSCWLVANLHLPYEAVMKPLFSHIALRAEQDGFKIYEATR